MVEESLRSNIIVAMDTGSGKTHIALSRTAAELEICHPDQIVWFLAPTATLCEQQYDVFCKNLPAHGTKVILGRDNVDHWTDQSTWDAVLKNIRIVLSTHQVLLDALTHAFVKMKQLALIIFDEAHHCTLNHPANRIMAHFYKPIASTKAGLPKILGLSASPVMRSKVTTSDLEKLEQNMHAVARSPKKHRSELLRYVHRPELSHVVHPTLSQTAKPPMVLQHLKDALRDYNIRKDPYIEELLEKHRRDDPNALGQLQKTMGQNMTYCKDQLRKLVFKGVATMEELGASPSEWYLHQCLAKFEALIRVHDRQLLDLSTKEKQHLATIFRQIPPQTSDSSVISLDQISTKVEMLIDTLVAEAAEDFTGLVFVEQRIWVAILAEILCTHPRTRELFNIGTFIGTSNSTSRKGNIADLAQAPNQQTTLDDFRGGKKNLILATSVLEEGIDISSCHLVVCFERPENLKSFVQRRGRARKQKSKYIIFVPDIGPSKSPQTWEMLEEEMKKQYLDDTREVKNAEKRELTEEGEKAAQLLYRVPTTGALLTFDNASQHLHHFCSILGSGPDVDPRPRFSFNEEKSKIKGEVTLPISVDPTVRTANSLMTWKTERNAARDAAFQAYRNLHLAGLVNDNLLPIREDADDMNDDEIPSDTPSLITVSPLLDPWVGIVNTQKQGPGVFYRLLLTLNLLKEKPIQMVFMTPTAVPLVPQFPLYWNESQTYSVTLSGMPSVVISEEEFAIALTVTRKLLYSVFHGRMRDNRDDFLWLLVPYEDQYTPEHKTLQEWDIATTGSREASTLIRDDRLGVSHWGLVTSRSDNNVYIVKSISHLNTCSNPPETTPQLEVSKVPKRRDFLHQIPRNNQGSKAHTSTFWVDAKNCTVANLPTRYSKFALFIPSIAAKIEMFMVADILRTTILKPLDFQDTHLGLIKQATTASMAEPVDNYQRLEFLGDCVLKFVASTHLMAAHLTWPEKYLTNKKSNIVSNGFLARATMVAGLDQFIFRRAFTGAKWSPRYISDLLNPDRKYPSERVLMSSKLLADVIESLIGASYIAGGLSKAFRCIQTLLPLEPWTPTPDCNQTLYEAAASDAQVLNLFPLESLIDYTFTKKSLLVEAITHASYNGPFTNVRSYERLEFLGDAVLDYIVSKRLYAQTPELPHYTMHSIRAAMVNASFLTFRMLEMTTEVEETNTTTLQPQTVKKALWMYMRSATNIAMTSLVDTTLSRHEEFRKQISDAMKTEGRYPWHLLALSDPPKHLSDLVESVIGAIYIDSGGDFSVCEAFVDRLGISACLERVLRKGVDCFHPKERLGVLAGNEGVEYRSVKSKGGGGGVYSVQVKVEGREVGGVVEGVKRLNAETIAAWKACKILEGTVDADGDEESGEDEFFDVDDGGGVELE
ncbi:hypothetical protein P154DRAFT_470302, partial [Amniculicola lignicola CBS 123094]